MQAQQSVADLRGLTVALEHPALNKHPKVLCAAARACQGWREAVQQCSACNTDVEIDLSNSLVSMVGFSEWLCKHAPLVRSISVTTASMHPFSLNEDIHGLQQDVHYRAVQRLLQQSLQLAALASTPCRALEQPAAAAAAAAAPAPAPQRRGLRLISFSSSCEKPGAVGVLAALPAYSLTSLHLSVQQKGTVDCTGVAAALARLSCLQQLQLATGPDTSFTTYRGGSCLSSVSHPSQLTSLRVEGRCWCGKLALRQLLSQPLQLRQLHLDGCDVGRSPLDLRGMSQLVDLALDHCGLQEGLTLPAQLQELQLDLQQWQLHLLSAVMPLQQLQRLRLHQGFLDQQPLLQLAQLPALQHLALQYSETVVVRHSVASWAKLPQLRELHISYECILDSVLWPEDMAGILDAIAACSNLTKLLLAAWQHSGIDDDDERYAVAACGKLAAVKTLKDLCLDESSLLTAGDARALTALTGLTRLVLGGLGDGVGDVAATALACSLRQLRHLDLQSCELGDMVCLAGIGQLTQLTALQLEGNDGLTREGLMLLTGLTSLQELGVSDIEGVTDADVEEYWAALRQQ